MPNQTTDRPLRNRIKAHSRQARSQMRKSEEQLQTEIASYDEKISEQRKMMAYRYNPRDKSRLAGWVTARDARRQALEVVASVDREALDAELENWR